MRWLVAALILTVPLVGCLSGDDAEPPGEDPPPGNETAPPPADEAPPVDNTTAREPDDNTTQAPQDNTTADPVPEPEPEPPAPVRIEHEGCRELLVLFNVPLANARPLVPENYTILGTDSGQAQAFAGLKECDVTRIDGEDIGPASTSDVGIQIEAPDGTEGLHYYQLWWPTDNPTYAALLQGQGWDAPHTPDDALEAAMTAGLGGEATFTVPWADGGTYGGSGNIFSPPAPADTDAVGWFDGPHGTVAIRKLLQADGQGGGSGMITAEAGSRMAELLGATEVSGPALYATYVMTGMIGPGV